MVYFNSPDLDENEPPPRPETPPIRRSFVWVLLFLTVAAVLVYGIPYFAERFGYAWESGRARAASEALAKLGGSGDKGIINQASLLFRLATTAVSPAVVNVHSQRSRRGGNDSFPGLALGGNRFNEGFQSAELGSGVIIDKAKGYIVTNNHVIKEADRIVVRLGPGDEVVARLVGADPKSDLAVLQVKVDLKVQAEWGDSDKLDIGDWVLAIGSPLGFDHSVTAGIVSATERNDVGINGEGGYESFIQTDAAINPGNSGGPLIDLAGKVIGINTAIITQTGGYEGIGLAIPSVLAKRVVDSLIKEGKVVRGYLGVRISGMDTDAAKKLGLENNHGALVSSVQPDSPAERAGLKERDVIVNIAGHEVPNPASLRNLTAGLDVDSPVPVTFFRNGKQQSATVTIAELPPAPELLAPLGLRIRSRQGSSQAESVLEIDQVITGSPAFVAGLRPGMRVLAVGDQRVSSPGQFEIAVRRLDPNQGLVLVVQTSDGRVGQVKIGAQELKAHP